MSNLSNLPPGVTPSMLEPPTPWSDDFEEAEHDPPLTRDEMAALGRVYLDQEIYDLVDKIIVWARGVERAACVDGERQDFDLYLGPALQQLGVARLDIEALRKREYLLLS